MADDFNPYHVWLGIPPKEQPANHYRLLSISLFETSGDVIDNAADRQMAHLRTIQVGKHGDLSQRLLNEVAAARICLLDPKKRSAYDQQLRAKLAATTAPAQPTGASPQSAGGSAIQRQPPRRTTEAAPATNIPTAAALPQPADQWDDLLGKPDVKPSTSVGGKAAKSAAAKRGASSRNLTIGIAVALVAVVGIGIFLLSGSSTDGTLAFDWPPNDRTDTIVSIDGVALAIPASGPWEYHYPAGSHRIVAEHLAYKLDSQVDVVAGERKAVPADWKPKATLVLNWPLALRSGAELRIDGRPQTISQHEPLELAVEPGRRTIQITRRGYDPIHTTAIVAADRRELVSIAAPPTTAKLVFDWPAAERKDAELIVDGSNRTIADGSDGEPFALKLEPGRHVVHITRRGFEPFNQVVDLFAGSDSAIAPTWTPEKRIVAAPTVAETPVPVRAPDQPAKKPPIPTAAEKEIADPKMAHAPFASDATAVKLDYTVNEHSWKRGQPNVRLIQKNRGFCFLASVSGHFAGYGDAARVFLANEGFWSLDARSEHDALTAMAISVEHMTPQIFKSKFTEFQWRNGDPPVKMLHKNNGICFLSAIGGRFEGPGERVSVRLADDGFWYLDGKSGQKELGANAVGIEWANPGEYSIEAEEHDWSVGDSPVALVKKGEGFAILSSVSGRFHEYGDQVRVHLGDNETWYLTGKSGQTALRATATAIHVSMSATSHTTIRPGEK